MKECGTIWLTGLPCSWKTTLAIAKKLYQRALKGEIKEFTGISAPFEEPDKADVVVDTERGDVRSCIRKILDAIGLKHPENEFTGQGRMKRNLAWYSSRSPTCCGSSAVGR